MEKIIDGKEIARIMSEEHKKKLAVLRMKNRVPFLSIVLIGEDEYSKKYVDDNLEVKNSMGMRNPLGMSVGLKIMNSYKVDYSNNTYIYKQKEFCNQLDIIPSKCVVFGLADKSHPEFGSFDRGTDFRRVCLSSLMGDMEDLRFKNNV